MPAQQFGVKVEPAVCVFEGGEREREGGEKGEKGREQEGTREGEREGGEERGREGRSEGAERKGGRGAEGGRKRIGKRLFSSLCVYLPVNCEEVRVVQRGGMEFSFS